MYFEDFLNKRCIFLMFYIFNRIVLVPFCWLDILEEHGFSLLLYCSYLLLKRACPGREYFMVMLSGKFSWREEVLSRKVSWGR